MFPLIAPPQGFPSILNPAQNSLGNPLLNPLFPPTGMKPEKSDALKKVFVKNIPNDVPDEFMESILRVFIRIDFFP